MAIRREHAKISTVAKLGKLAGQAVSARRDYERREVALQQAQESQRREELAQFEAQEQMKREQMSIQWDTQKMAMASQQKLALEDMRQQALAERELAKEVRKLNEYDMAQEKMRELRSTGELNEEQYKQYQAKVDMKFLGYPGVLPSSQGPGFGVAPWSFDPQYSGTPEATAHREKLTRPQAEGSVPWFHTDKWKDTPQGIAAQEEAGYFRDETVAPSVEEDLGGMSVEELERLAGLK